MRYFWLFGSWLHVSQCLKKLLFLFSKLFTYIVLIFCRAFCKVQMPFVVFVKDDSAYVKIYSVCFNIFNNHFYFTQLIYSFAATSMCKIGTKDCCIILLKEVLTILPLLFNKVGNYLWTGYGFAFSILCHTFLKL